MLPCGTATKVRGQYNMTSASVRALMGNAESPDTRRFLSRCDNTTYIPIPGSLPSSLSDINIQKGTHFNTLLLPQELLWNGTCKSPDSHRSKHQPFSSTVIKKEHTELPLSTNGKGSLFKLVKEKQKMKYADHRIGKFSRCPDVKSRTNLLDDSPLDSNARNHITTNTEVPFSPLRLGHTA